MVFRREITVVSLCLSRCDCAMAGFLAGARQGMVIFVPKGSSSDPTRPPAYYDQTFDYLISCGIKPLAPITPLVRVDKS